MPAGIRVTVAFPGPANCPIAEASARADTAITDVATSVSMADTDATVSEFLLDAAELPSDFEHDPVFAYADRYLYRVHHDAGCPCCCLGEFQTPIYRYEARDGAFEIVFHASEFDRLQSVVGELRERYPDLDIRRMIREPTGGATHDTVFVDRSALTERQREVLESAYERGYFDRPRGANATDLAAELDVTPSTVREHLAAAQSKLLGDVFEKRR